MCLNSNLRTVVSLLLYFSYSEKLRMTTLSHKKHFTIHHANPNKHFTLCIALDGVVIHHTQSFKTFIKHLGYSDVVPTVLQEKSDFTDINHKMNTFENIDLASETCLQYKITEYL